MPLNKKDTKLSLFSINNYHLNASAFANNSSETNLVKCLKNEGWDVNQKLDNLYQKNIKNYKSSWKNETTFEFDKQPFINEMPYSIIDNNKNVVNSFSEYNTAIFTLTRGGGENNDLIDSYLKLTVEESEILNYINSNFDNIILIINSSNQVYLNWINEYENIKAILNIGMTGKTGINAVSDILEGKINPSGKLGNTCAYDFSKSPSAINYKNSILNYSTPFLNEYVNYQEGIYVGYKYYETRYFDKLLNMPNVGNFDYYNEVQFPFGYGLSYTDFLYSDFKINEDTDNNKDTIDLSVNIKNIGNYSGKEAVQLYLQKPYTDYDKNNLIEKPAIELIDFDKTRLLNPGESQNIEFHINKEIFKVYDSNKAKTYIDESGKYYFATGKDVHDSLNNIIERINPNLVEGNENLSIEYNHETKTNEQVDSTSYSTNKNGVKITNLFDKANINYYGYNVKYLTRSDWQGTMPYKSNGLIANEQLLKALNNENYQNISRNKDKNIDGIINIDEKELFKKINIIINGESSTFFDQEFQFNWQKKDGPQGIYDYGYNVSSLQIQASTFNKNLIYDFGSFIGDVLNLNHNNYWYGIGINLHRNYLNGRNFEYYSEDNMLVSLLSEQVFNGSAEKGIEPVLKHLVLNEIEENRHGLITFINEQAFREIYLQPFDYLLDKTKVQGIMGSFNRVGVEWSNISIDLIISWLRREKDFNGFVVTDAYDFPEYMNIELGLEKGTLDLVCFIKYDSYLPKKIFESIINDKNYELLNNVTSSFDRIMNSYNNIPNSKNNFHYNFNKFLKNDESFKYLYWLILLIVIIILTIVAIIYIVLWKKRKLFRF